MNHSTDHIKDIPTLVEKKLGLTREQASELFFPYSLGPASIWEDLTTRHAVRVLDIFLETGEIDWARAVAEA